MLGLLTTVHSGAEVSPDSPREQLHHHAKQPASERRVPSAFGRFVADESMLRLHLDQLPSASSISLGRYGAHGEGDAGVIHGVTNQCAPGTIYVCVLEVSGGITLPGGLACLPKTMVTSPLPFRSPCLIRARVSSDLPLPSVAECTLQSGVASRCSRRSHSVAK